MALKKQSRVKKLFARYGATHAYREGMRLDDTAENRLQLAVVEKVSHLLKERHFSPSHSLSDFRSQTIPLLKLFREYGVQTLPELVRKLKATEIGKILRLVKNTSPENLIETKAITTPLSKERTKKNLLEKFGAAHAYRPKMRMNAEAERKLRLAQELGVIHLLEPEDFNPDYGLRRFMVERIPILVSMKAAEVKPLEELHKKIGAQIVMPQAKQKRPRRSEEEKRELLERYGVSHLFPRSTSSLSSDAEEILKSARENEVIHLLAAHHLTSLLRLFKERILPKILKKKMDVGKG